MKEEQILVSHKILMPLEMTWQPKKDITAYELSLCIPYLLRQSGIMPHEIDVNLKHFRHFKIINHNQNNEKMQPQKKDS